ncbi:LacI family transcriptional regulator [Clostridium swellfunianum]|uniref:LacI family DNA-binding transcriptional regulator n=1 Tax=Clostridium swellfunianum TaxID=1367462 RepID=UPI00202F7BCF|nr:LacI family DNA-binding transcriptional regulator [Clostridium swellfunianum]MCM0650088.1 LacI family transcriptional regulator [Clostridium swellfunianum]
MKTTVRKIATAAGVSPATVSRYFNGNQKLNSDTIEKIEIVLQDMEYSPKMKKIKSSNLIGVLLPHLRYGFYGDALRELIEQAENYNFSLVIIPTNQENSYSYKDIVEKHNFRGIIYFEEEIDKDILNFMEERGIRTVMCGGAALNHSSDMVHVNDMAAAYEGTKYLIKLGHRDIMFISDHIQNISAGFQRMTGSKRAMEESSLKFEEEAISYGPVTYEAGYEATKRFLDKGKKFTAIFAYSDELAMGAMAALFDAGIRVPEEVSVLGFDDLQIASRIRPALTTIHQPMKSFITKTLELFLEEGKIDNVEISLPFCIKERGSCMEINREAAEIESNRL